MQLAVTPRMLNQFQFIFIKEYIHMVDLLT